MSQTITTFECFLLNQYIRHPLVTVLRPLQHLLEPQRFSDRVLLQLPCSLSDKYTEDFLKSGQCLSLKQSSARPVLHSVSFILYKRYQ